MSENTISYKYPDDCQCDIGLTVHTVLNPCVCNMIKCVFFGAWDGGCWMKQLICGLLQC